jgi:2-oxoglutarate ferredoxin oxidoreductase subunit alpha
VTNWGDETNLVVAFNEQVLLARHRLGARAQDAILLVEDKWAGSDDPAIQAAWTAAMAELSTGAYRVIGPHGRVSLSSITLGKNMFAPAGLDLPRDLELVREQVARPSEESEEVFQQNLALLQPGYAWAEAD